MSLKLTVTAYLATPELASATPATVVTVPVAGVVPATWREVLWPVVDWPWPWPWPGRPPPCAPGSAAPAGEGTEGSGRRLGGGHQGDGGGLADLHVGDLAGVEAEGDRVALGADDHDLARRGGRGGELAAELFRSRCRCCRIRWRPRWRPTRCRCRTRSVPPVPEEPSCWPTVRFTVATVPSNSATSWAPARAVWAAVSWSWAEVSDDWSAESWADEAELAESSASLAWAVATEDSAAATRALERGRVDGREDVTGLDLSVRRPR